MYLDNHLLYFKISCIYQKLQLPLFDTNLLALIYTSSSCIVGLHYFGAYYPFILPLAFVDFNYASTHVHTFKLVLCKFVPFCILKYLNVVKYDHLKS